MDGGFFSIPHRSSLSFTVNHPFTIEAWVKPNKNSWGGYIISKFNATDAGDFWLSIVVCFFLNIFIYY